MPLGGISHATTVDCNESGQFSVYKSDRFGFRNPDSVYDVGAAPIVIIGDSFAHGGCVQEGKDVAGRLRHRGFPTINMGMRGNGPLLELATLKEYGLPHKPKLVLWLYYEGNDLDGLKISQKNTFLNRYLYSEYSQNLISRQSEVDQLLKSYAKFLKKKKIIELTQLRETTRTEEVNSHSLKD